MSFGKVLYRTRHKTFHDVSRSLLTGKRNPMSKILMSQPIRSVSTPAENTVDRSWKPIIIYTALAFVDRKSVV